MQDCFKVPSKKWISGFLVIHIVYHIYLSRIVLLFRSHLTAFFTWLNLWLCQTVPCQQPMW